MFLHLSTCLHRQRLHEEWLERERLAQEEFRLQREKEEAAKRKKEEEEVHIKLLHHDNKQLDGRGHCKLISSYSLNVNVKIYVLFMFIF